MSSPSIDDYYSEDHDRLDELFQQFQSHKSSDPERAKEAFKAFHSGLERHIAWEEEILFPTFEKKTENAGGPTQVMRLEHQQIRGCLGVISEKLARGEGDTNKDEADLLSVLEQHNYKEENILFPMLDQITSQDERTRIFDEMNGQV